MRAFPHNITGKGPRCPYPCPEVAPELAHIVAQEYEKHRERQCDDHSNVKAKAQTQGNRQKLDNEHKQHDTHQDYFHYLEVCSSTLTAPQSRASSYKDAHQDIDPYAYQWKDECIHPLRTI